MCSKFDNLATNKPYFASEISRVKVNSDDSSTSGSELEDANQFVTPSARKNTIKIIDLTSEKMDQYSEVFKPTPKIP